MMVLTLSLCVLAHHSCCSFYADNIQPAEEEHFACQVTLDVRNMVYLSFRNNLARLGLFMSELPFVIDSWMPLCMGGV
jgi:hypothetical protein